MSKYFTLEKNIRLRRIPEIHNYCNHWCERCPLAHRCGVYQVNSQGADISILSQGLEPAEKGGKNPFEELNLKASADLEEVIKKQEAKAPLNLSEHVLMQNFQHWEDFYQSTVEYLEKDLVHEYLAMPILRKQEEQEIDNAFSVLEYYQGFLGPKLSRALGGKHDFVEGLELMQSDWNGTAKLALLVLADIIKAIEKLLHYFGETESKLMRFWQLSQNLKDQMKHEFPYARNFVRPGFDILGLGHNLGLE